MSEVNLVSKSDKEDFYRVFDHTKMWRKSVSSHVGTLPALALVAVAALAAFYWEIAHAYLLEIACVVVIGISVRLLKEYKANVYLVDFRTLKVPEHEISNEEFMEMTKATGWFSEESVEFQRKVMARNCIGDACQWPPALSLTPPAMTMAQARDESMLIFTKVVDELLASTNTKPKDVDILIVNCSLFCPTPSLTSMIVNKYKMKEDILTYNLGGMGCSAGLISIALAKDLLSVHKNATCLVVSTEITAQSWYKGADKSMMLSNTLFRMGGAAVLLSSKKSDRARAKYQLLHTVRTHTGAKDESYNCVFSKEDDEGNRGVSLSRELVKVAGEAITANIKTLAPKVLPLSEKLRYFWTNIIQRKYLGKKSIPTYIPNFRKAFDYFCIHAGGRGVLDAVQKSLSLSDADVRPSRATLYRYGNTSSSSVWYELEYLEKTRQPMTSGQKVWQIAFGSGFKCNSAVWSVL